MRWGLAVVALSLIASGCDRLADPVSSQIFFETRLFGPSTDLRGQLPKEGELALQRLAEFGYEPDPLLAELATPDPSQELSWMSIPATDFPESAHERVYFSKKFSNQHGSEGFGVVVDLNREGSVITAVGFKSWDVMI